MWAKGQKDKQRPNMKDLPISTRKKRRERGIRNKKNFLAQCFYYFLLLSVWEEDESSAKFL